MKTNVYAPISVEELHFWHPADPARKEIVDAILDGKRNAANFGVGNHAGENSCQPPKSSESA